MIEIPNLKYDENGLIPAIVQDNRTKDVLMFAYMNQESLNKTLKTRNTWFYSRSRQDLWNKGETSGNFQEVVSIQYDCDEDTLLILVNPKGPSCHTNNNSCFYRDILQSDKNTSDSSILKRVYKIIEDRIDNPKEDSYTNYLFNSGIDKILKKIGEESAETIIAAKNNSADELVYEISDLVYHLLVLLAYQNIDLEDIYRELESRY